MRKEPFVEGEYYHIYNRGVDRRTVFSTPQEYKRFLAYLFLLNDQEQSRVDYLLGSSHQIWKAKPSRPLVAIGAYCLMPNHFHLYVTPRTSGGVSKFMQRLQTAYTMYFNKKHGRSGALFQGTFKSQRAASDVYAKYLFSYIHLNPAKLKDPKWKTSGATDLRKLSAFIKGYPYSSFSEYQTRDHYITQPDAFPDYFADAREVDDHIDSWLACRQDQELEGLAFQKKHEQK